MAQTLDKINKIKKHNKAVMTNIMQTDSIFEVFRRGNGGELVNVSGATKWTQETQTDPIMIQAPKPESVAR